jgi:4-amino-4-deoxy-L-arabinose transferase-like glycosyltransferase
MPSPMPTLTLAEQPRWRSWISEAQPLIFLIVFFVLFNANWIWQYRFKHGFLLNIDEAGYFSYALVDYYNLHYAGFSGWLAAIDMASIQAPLTMALTSLLFAVTGPHIILGFAVPLGAGAGSVALAYALGKSLDLGRSALLGALLTASCPVFLNYSRAYLFATPAAFFATLALVAILRSRNFSSLFWALVFGSSLGLLPLARTMTVAFLPGLVLGALVILLNKSERRLSRLRNLCLGLLAGILIAAPWFWKNGLAVAQYLFNYGYDKHALEYGAKVSAFTLQSITSKLDFILNAEIYFPAFFIICLGILTLCVIIAQTIITHGVRPTLQRIFSSSLLPILIFNVTALLALSSSGNGGSGFLVPVIPAIMVQTGWALWRVRLPYLAHLAVATLAIITAIIPLIFMAALTPNLARARSLNLPLLGGTTITNGLGPLQGYEIRAGYGVPGALLGTSESQAWVHLSAWTAMMLTQKFGPQANVMFAFRNALYNVNTLNLQELIKFHGAFAEQMIDPVETGTSLAGYTDWLTKNGPVACALLFSDQAKGDFNPQIDPQLMKAAASQSGFVQVLTWPAPDGQHIELWQHRDPVPNCSPH